MCELRLPCCWVAYIPTAAPFLCLVIEFDNASAQAAPGAQLYGWLVFEEGFFCFFLYNFLCHTADLEAVSVIKELIAAK